MSQEEKRAENYDAQNLLDTINETREFLLREIEFAEAGPDDARRFLRMKMAAAKAVEGLTPQSGG